MKEMSFLWRKTCFPGKRHARWDRSQ